MKKTTEKKNANKGSNKSALKKYTHRFHVSAIYISVASFMVWLHPDDELIAHCLFINNYEAIIIKQNYAN